VKSNGWAQDLPPQRQSAPDWQVGTSRVFTAFGHHHIGVEQAAQKQAALLAGIGHGATPLNTDLQLMHHNGLGLFVGLARVNPASKDQPTKEEPHERTTKFDDSAATAALTLTTALRPPLPRKSGHADGLFSIELPFLKTGG